MACRIGHWPDVALARLGRPCGAPLVGPMRVDSCVVSSKAALCGAVIVVGAVVIPSALAQAAPPQPTATTSQSTITSSAATTTTPPEATSGTTTSTDTANAPASSMPPPSGYTAQQLIFDDQFSGTLLNRSKWSTYLGAQGIRWNADGVLPFPYSGGDDVARGGNDLAMYGPAQVSVDNGLTLTAQPNTNQWASGYPWISGVVTTMGKFTLPTTGWYVQIKAKMPNMTDGMWPAIWFMPAVAGTSVNELDGYEGGFVLYGPPNQVVHSTYFVSPSLAVANNVKVSAGLAAGFHVYGIQWIPGVSITIYLDGTQVSQVTEAEAGSIPAEPYEIMLQLLVAAGDLRWHTVTNSSTPTSSMQVDEVQAYS